MTQALAPAVLTFILYVSGTGCLDQTLRQRPNRRLDEAIDMLDNPTVLFYLYTKEHSSPYQLFVNDTDRLHSSTFNPTIPTKILIHGFRNSYLSESVQGIKQAYLHQHDSDVNVLAVDWSEAAGPFYIRATASVRPVAVKVAAMLDFLVTTTAHTVDISLIGHSLGAHISGFAANNVRSAHVSRITGLDPALPLFLGTVPADRLDPTDADVVDCIHTCGGTLGFYEPICLLDFYPNGGTPPQPGCGVDVTGDCSHSMSHRYYAASVSVQFTAKSCDSLDQVTTDSCSGHTNGSMGNAAKHSPPGLYYINTNPDYPYAKF